MKEEIKMYASDEINYRAYERNLPSKQLKPEFTPRPLPTKYVTLYDIANPPVIEKPREFTYSEYSVGDNFNPGNRRAPFDGFIKNVNLESELRNQYTILSNDNNKWFPSSHSDMYKGYRPPSTTDLQPFPRLFTEAIFNEFNPNTNNPSSKIWENHTRQQLKQKKM